MPLEEEWRLDEEEPHGGPADGSRRPDIEQPEETEGEHASTVEG